MTDQHTPSPWWAEEYDIERNNKQILICIGEGEDASDGAKVYGANRIANARLIAAAPELYEALRNILKELLRQDSDMTKSEIPPEADDWNDLASFIKRECQCLGLEDFLLENNHD